MESTRRGHCSSLCPRHRPRRNEIGLDADQPDHHESDEGIKNCKRYDIVLNNDVTHIVDLFTCRGCFKVDSNAVVLDITIGGLGCINISVKLSTTLKMLCEL